MRKRELLVYILLFFCGIFVYAAFALGNNVATSYLWLLLPGLFLAVISYLAHRKNEREKLLLKLRQLWGKPKGKKCNLEDASHLFDNATKPEGVIDDRTWHDLNMDIIFAQINRTFTWPGIQRLYQILRISELTNLSILQKRGEVINTFQKNQKQREDVQIVLSTMDESIGSGLANLLWSTPVISEVHSLLLYKFMFFLAVLAPFLLFFGKSNIIWVVLIFQVNMYLHFKVQKSIKSYFEGVRSLKQLIHVGKHLSVLEHEGIDELLLKVRDSINRVEQFSKIVRYVGIETTDPMMATFQQYFTILFLAEVRGFYRALDFIRANREALQDLFLAVGEIDALQAIASYRSNLDYYCEPKFVQDRYLQLEDAYHPLLAEPISNSINVQDKGVLITGSNMSGKSTFLRTVGLNALFAQTIVTCLARKYEACPVRLLTSIGRSDNVVEGKSYYLEEALGVLRVLDALNEDTVTLAIFDEMFRGTNSEERIVAGKRVLEYLVIRNAMVFVATHDLELTKMLNNYYSSVHFSERVGALGLEFDYTLKKGPATTKNAIALLRYLKYPKEITDP